MNEADHDFLERLTEQSRAKQKTFMQNIASRLGRPIITEKPDHPHKGAPPFWQQFTLDEEQRIQLFSDNWSKAGGHVIRFSNMEQAGQFITERAAELKARLLIRHNQPELNRLRLEERLLDTRLVVWQPGSNEELLTLAAGADIGVIAAEHAVAHTGSIVVTSSGDRGRSVSLLPAVLMAIIPTERIKTRLGEVLGHFDGMRREQFPAGIHFISGPSRSADIENDLTIGVHGPGVVFALIVG